ncbi:MAG: 2-oxoacid:acceptor oxidoreductase subunit alpha [Deltaproteobacteria bacterium]|nr:2-oxoacid:acceptor oxidoreductase subunit alpha [Deltaproteobacteria bacterium]MBW2255887.1 2-oxoacid:acceptor oxidoreductase subunit alpha [Deltaproteobacteria bacterium]
MPQGATRTVEGVVIRFAGDSGDGMQLTGTQLTRTSALAGNDLATLPDFPAEIRAPAGTRAGVSAFQVHFASHDIYTPGDIADVLVAMNPAALATNLATLRKGGLVVVNSDRFTRRDLDKARLDTNPLEDGTLAEYQVLLAPISATTARAVEGLGLNSREADRCKNFFALGMMYWLYTRDPEPTRGWLETKFRSPFMEANLAALNAGYHYAETVEIFQDTYQVLPATDLPKGLYRNITGNRALAIGLVVGANKADIPLFYGSYPITPASDILHALAPFKNYGVVTFQAEDEIAAVCSSIGASWGGSIGVTGTSGPGLALKAEAIGLAVAVELPLVVVNVQRAGPSTGMPTKTEQADLLQALYGRNGESPVPIIAPSTPADCFQAAVDAVRIAIRYRVPVILLSDGYLGNGAEPWHVPDLDTIPAIEPRFQTDPEGFEPYRRDEETLARPWAVPGTPGLAHRVGGLEKADITGDVSYDPQNHERMCQLRAEKVERVRQLIPPTVVHGADHGLLVLGWGSTYGAIRASVNDALKEGRAVAHVHLRFLNPLPEDLGEILSRYDQVLVPELNLGQLVRLIRTEFLVDAIPFNKIQGQPFARSEIAGRIDELTP